MSKYVGADNSKIIARNQHGGNKKQGLAPCATHYFMANATGKEYYTETGDGRQRFTLVCMNQLGGIGKGRSQFRPNADGERNCDDEDDILLAVIIHDVNGGESDNTPAKSKKLPPIHITPTIITSPNQGIFTWFGLYSSGMYLTGHQYGVKGNASNNIIMTSYNFYDKNRLKYLALATISNSGYAGKYINIINMNEVFSDKNTSKFVLSQLGQNGYGLFNNVQLVLSNPITQSQLKSLLSAQNYNDINKFTQYISANGTLSNINSENFTNLDFSASRFLNAWFNDVTTNHSIQTAIGSLNSNITDTWTSSMTDISKAEIFLFYNTNGIFYGNETPVYFYHETQSNIFSEDGLTQGYFTGLNLDVSYIPYEANNDYIQELSSNYNKVYFGTNDTELSRLVTQENIGISRNIVKIKNGKTYTVTQYN